MHRIISLQKKAITKVIHSDHGTATSLPVVIPTTFQLSLSCKKNLKNKSAVSNFGTVFLLILFGQPLTPSNSNFVIFMAAISAFRSRCFCHCEESKAIL
jgi:L-asparagine transporter-like permease